MITRYALLFIGLSLFASANAQVDWTATDINGTTWHLQDLLDEGKTVLVNVATLGCPNRDEFHDTGILQKIQREFGPEGTNDVMVFWVAVDNPSLGALQSYSGHDFTIDAPYAVIGPNGQGGILGNAYDYTGGIHFYAHCAGDPTPLLVGYPEWWYNTIHTMRNYCPAAFDNGAIDLRLMVPEYCSACADGRAWVSLYDQGTTPVHNATLTLEKDGQLVETYEWSGSIGTYMPWDVQFPMTHLEEGHTYTAHASVPGEITTVGNSAVVPFSASVDAPSRILFVQVATDAHPQQIGWSITAEDGNTVFQRSPGFYTEPHDTIGQPVSVNADGCYTFRVWDTGGNGICCNSGNGFFRIKNRFGAPVFFIQGGEFDDAQEFVFHAPAEEPNAIGERIAYDDLQVYPNPSNGLVNLEVPVGEEVTVEVFGALGAGLLSQTWTSASPVRTIDLGAYNDGVYVVAVRTADAVSTQRVLLSK
ncbi:MAG: T9SS type A sorting domain-containing protein [Flavobacteriales bacterium]|nr:T9SS type A sorting domain-containing protein [Flavobacteriales bacterium]